jgi:UPF0176 protein
MKVISFYKYVHIEYPEDLAEKLRAFCQTLEIKGRILLGKEGINGAVCGKIENITQFKLELRSIFEGLTFREQLSNINTYHKLIIRIRSEIVKFGKNISLKNTGTLLHPKQLKEWYDAKEDFIMLDARNSYETHIGKFKNAIELPINNFREFPAATKQLDKYKNKKIVLYCTGGIRCEKASAYMKGNGFKKIYHLEGGIINYVNRYKEHWQGGLFVFDDRLVEDVSAPLTACTWCHAPTANYRDCHNLQCDKLFIVCKQCKKDNCSEQCETGAQRRKVIKREVLGKVVNYYSKAHVALVKLDKPLTVENNIIIKGKTTDLNVHVSELRDYDENQITHALPGSLVTFRVNSRVRENDRIII